MFISLHTIAISAIIVSSENYSANLNELSVLPEAVGPIRKIAGVWNLYVI